MGDEGGFAPNLAKAEDALELIAKATEAAGYSLGEQVFIVLDSATSEMVGEGRSRAKRATASSRVIRPAWRPPTR